MKEGERSESRLDEKNISLTLNNVNATMEHFYFQFLLNKTGIKIIYMFSWLRQDQTRYDSKYICLFSDINLCSFIY